jgi:amidase/nitrilase
MIIDPTGIIQAGPVLGEETLLTAEFSRWDRRVAKTYFDAMGHYTRWDAVQLQIDDSRVDPTVNGGERDRHCPVQESRWNRPTAFEIEMIADDAGVSVETVERVLDRIVTNQEIESPPADDE